MELLYLAGGVFIGAAFCAFLENRTKSHGVIEVDHNTEQCKVCMTSVDLSNRKTKKVLFKVNHDANISREEQVL